MHACVNGIAHSIAKIVFMPIREAKFKEKAKRFDRLKYIKPTVKQHQSPLITEQVMLSGTYYHPKLINAFREFGKWKQYGSLFCVCVLLATHPLLDNKCYFFLHSCHLVVQ